MITDNEMTDAFTEVLAAAGAEVCESCGSRALVRAEALDADSAEPPSGGESGERAGRAARFCFACGHEQPD